MFNGRKINIPKLDEISLFGLLFDGNSDFLNSLQSKSCLGHNLSSGHQNWAIQQPTRRYQNFMQDPSGPAVKIQLEQPRIKPESQPANFFSESDLF